MAAVRVATFNAGLAVGVLPHVTERLPRVLDALASLDVDLLFVQEFWLDDHWHALREALAPRLPYVLRPAPLLGPSGGCTEEMLAPLVSCAVRHCAGLRDEALAACVVRYCATHGLGLPAECLNCIARDTRGTLDEIVRRCVDTAVSHQPASTSAAGYDSLVAYGGSLGTGLLSRVPLAHPDELVYEATVNARGAVYARARLGRLGAVHVFATHFSPGGAEHGPQVDDLVAWVADKAPREEPALLLGDFNTAPGSTLFREILHAGFREPDVVDPRGTWGSGLGTGEVSETGWRIDHVLVRDLAARVTTRRILDEPITLPGGARTTLSDHYGVLATIEGSEHNYNLSRPARS